MLGQDRKPGLTWQVAFALAMAVLVLVLLGTVLTREPDQAPNRIQAFIESKLAGLSIAEAGAPSDEAAQPPVDSHPAGAGSPIGESMPPQESATPTLQISTAPTLKPVDAIRRDHYWLERPIAAPAELRIARYYPYGSRMDGSYPVHYGVEMVNPEGTPVLAPASGVVVAAGSDEQHVYGARPGFYGQLIILQLDQRFQGRPVYAVFGHLSAVQVAIGQTVSLGQQIGLVGASGDAEAPHLHTEVRIGKNDYGYTANPELWYRPLEGRGTLAGALLDSRGNLVDTETKIVLTSAAGATLETFTYPLDYVNPDPEWTENFAVGDLPAGAWTAKIWYQGRLYTEEFNVSAGQTTWLPIRAG